jgi:hypothetical protein
MNFNIRCLKPVKMAPVSATMTQPAFQVPGNGRGHYADFGSF